MVGEGGAVNLALLPPLFKGEGGSRLREDGRGFPTFTQAGDTPPLPLPAGGEGELFEEGDKRLIH